MNLGEEQNSMQDSMTQVRAQTWANERQDEHKVQEISMRHRIIKSLPTSAVIALPKNKTCKIIFTDYKPVCQKHRHHEKIGPRWHPLFYHSLGT